MTMPKPYKRKKYHGSLDQFLDTIDESPRICYIELVQPCHDGTPRNIIVATTLLIHHVI